MTPFADFARRFPTFFAGNYDVTRSIGSDDVDDFLFSCFFFSLLPQKGMGMMSLQSNLVSRWMRWRAVMAAPL